MYNIYIYVYLDPSTIKQSVFFFLQVYYLYHCLGVYGGSG